MIFESLTESAARGELILVEGGFCRFHIRRDGQLTIREIIVVTPGIGIGSAILNRLKSAGRNKGAICIVAKCPADLVANDWYKRRGFIKVMDEVTPTGRNLNVWRLSI